MHCYESTVSCIDNGYILSVNKQYKNNTEMYKQYKMDKY